MKREVCLSILCATVLYAQESVVLEQIEVKSDINKKIVKNVSSQELKNADLADALTKAVPSISIVKRSGIANDIILRGQKKDNINIIIDNAKIYGACPNRMDAPISHILTNNIENISIIEGPYDVENFGTLSGLIKIDTKKPKEELVGDINLNVGSFGYKKASATLSGGTENLRLLISASSEEGDQYKDGDGNDFFEQQKNQGMMIGNQYISDDLKSFEKDTLLAKGIVNITDDNELSLSYTANRSDTILYGAGPMDADYDDSDIYSLSFTSRELGSFSKELDFEYYYSKVDHPMSNKLRNSGKVNYSTNHLKTSIWGARVANKVDINRSTLLTLGVDTSRRNWRGQMLSTNVASGISTVTSTTLSSTDTTNKAIFAKVEKNIGKLDLDFGARYDNTDVDVSDSRKKDNKYVAFNANVFAVYNIDENTRFFAGFGKSARVPDARELYSTVPTKSNENLKQTQNYEFDLGFEKVYENFTVRTKLFYSMLKDYIYNVGGITGFENIDATIYGFDIGGTYFASDYLYIDYGLAYQRGKKDGSSFLDKNLAEIPPLKANITFNFEFGNSRFITQIVAVDRWDKFDASANEQELAGYALLNLKYNYDIGKGFDITLGVDNLLDKTYASTNTYQDIKYAVVGGDPILFYDAGRYMYANLRYQF